MPQHVLQELIKTFTRKLAFHVQAPVNNVLISQQSALHVTLLSIIHKFFTMVYVIQNVQKVHIKLVILVQIVILRLHFVKAVIFKRLTVLLANLDIFYQDQTMVHATHHVPVKQLIALKIW